MNVKIFELKNRLSHYLRLVRKGQPILITHRSRVVARLEPAGEREAAGEDDLWLAELERRGTLRRRRGRLPAGWLDSRPAVDADVVATLLEEREAGR